jgi:hypothetical protein
MRKNFHTFDRFMKKCLHFLTQTSFLTVAVQGAIKKILLHVCSGIYFALNYCEMEVSSFFYELLLEKLAVFRLYQQLRCGFFCFVSAPCWTNGWNNRLQVEPEECRGGPSLYQGRWVTPGGLIWRENEPV